MADLPRYGRAAVSALPGYPASARTGVCSPRRWRNTPGWRAARRSPPSFYCAVCRLRAQHGSGEPFDPVRPEARPVLVSGHDDRRLQVSQCHHVVTGLGVQADVDLLVGDALLVQRLVGGVALHAGRLGVNGDAHRGTTPLSIVETRQDWQLLGYCICIDVQRAAAPQNSRLAGPLQLALDAGCCVPTDQANLGSVGLRNTTPSGCP